MQRDALAFLWNGSRARLHRGRGACRRRSRQRDNRWR